MLNVGAAPTRLVLTSNKSLVSTYSTTAAYGCERLDSNQRPPAYEAGDLDLLSTPQYIGAVYRLTQDSAFRADFPPK